VPSPARRYRPRAGSGPPLFPTSTSGSRSNPSRPLGQLLKNPRRAPCFAHLLCGFQKEAKPSALRLIFFSKASPPNFAASSLKVSPPPCCAMVLRNSGRDDPGGAAGFAFGFFFAQKTCKPRRTTRNRFAGGLRFTAFLDRYLPPTALLLFTLNCGLPLNSLSAPRAEVASPLLPGFIFSYVPSPFPNQRLSASACCAWARPARRGA